MKDRDAPPGPEQWLKELENRLQSVGARLADAAVHLARTTKVNSEIGSRLSLVQELIAQIEDRVGRLSSEVGDVRDEPPPPIAYREVPGFSGYRVGDDGSIWGSRSAGRGYGRTREWRPLKPYLVRPGPTLTVSLYRERTRYLLSVGALVLLAFVGPCPDGFAPLHVNGDPSDNRLSNLRYAPRAAVV